MSDKDIEIGIKTTGDTSGAEAVEKAVKQVGNAAEDAGKKAAAPVHDNEANLRGRAVAWAQLAEKLTQYGAAARTAAQNIEGLDKETKNLVENVGAATETVGGILSAVSQGFAAGGPIGAVVAAATKGVGEFVKAWGSAGAEIQKANEKSEQSVQMWQRLQNLKLKLPILEALEGANKLLDEQLQKMMRNARVAEADRGLEQANQEAGGSDAVRSGKTTPEAANALNLATSAENQIERIREKLTISANAQKLLEGKVAEAAADADTMAADSKDLAAKLEEAKTLAAAAKKGAEALATDEQVAEKEIAEIKVKVEETAKNYQDAAFDALTQSVTQQRDALKAEVDRLGANASSGARASLEIWNEILADGKVRADELAKYAKAQGLLNGMVEKAHAEVMEGFLASESNYRALIESIRPVISRIRDLGEQMKEMPRW